MRPEDAAADPERLARTLVAENSYLTLATAAADGTPWATPVWFASRGLELYVWASKPRARHSQNIAENPHVSLVIYDSSRAPGEGSALYVAARAELVPDAGFDDAGFDDAGFDDAGFDDALAVYNARSVERGLGEWDPARLREPARHRLYRAVALESCVGDDHHGRVRGA